MSDIKREFRKRFMRIRNEISKKDRTSMSLRIEEKILGEDYYKNVNTVFIYVSMGSEVETHSLINKMHTARKRVIVPRCNTISHTMELYEIKGFEQLEVGAYGILEPRCDLIANNALTTVEVNDIDLAVVPGVVFDSLGMRIGYGGGYYDRFLKEFQGISVGLAFPQCVVEKIPIEEFDCGVNIVVCPEEMI